MVTFTETKKRPPMPLPHLLHPVVEVENQTFTRGAIVEIFGNAFPLSHITKIQGIFGIPKYDPMPRSDIWKIYIYQCWRQVQMTQNGTKSAWQSRFLVEWRELGAEAFLEKYVEKIHGSQENCNEMIDKYLAKKFTSKLN